MKNFTCPKCDQEAIPVKAKYLASHWANIHCSNCGARLCAEPILLTLLYFCYFWAIAWFLIWAMAEQNWGLALFLIPTWLLIDFLSVLYLPLRVLRPKAVSPPGE